MLSQSMKTIFGCIKVIGFTPSWEVASKCKIYTSLSMSFQAEVVTQIV